jgi:hypothetical protein
MWCFLDESIPDEGGATVIAGCLMQTRTIRRLDRELFVIRRDRFGDAHARDLTKEIKGQTLLSKQSFKMADRHGQSINHNVAADIFNVCTRMRGRHPIHIVGSVVYGTERLLTEATGPRLQRPLTHILNAISDAACRINPNDRVNLVFDEQLGIRAGIAARARQFISGVDLPNVSHFPLSAVSHVTPGLQLADLCAYILGRQAMGDARFGVWMSRVRGHVWVGRNGNGFRRSGIAIFEQLPSGEIARRPCWRPPAQKKGTG